MSQTIALSRRLGAARCPRFPLTGRRAVPPFRIFDRSSEYKTNQEMFYATGRLLLFRVEVPTLEGDLLMLTSKLQNLREQQPFGGLVRQLREERGWTQEQLAREAGITTASVSNVERGATKPATETVDKLAAAFGLPPADLDPRRLGDIVTAEAGSLPRRQAIRRLLALPDRDIDAILRFLDERKGGSGRRSPR